MKNLADPNDAAEIRIRILSLTSSDAPQWGIMTANQMVCHVRQAFVLALEEGPVKFMKGPLPPRALKFAALKQHVKLPGSSVKALVSLGPEGDAFALAVKLVVELPGLEREEALQLVEAAHQVCPYSRATRGNIGVELELL